MALRSTLVLVLAAIVAGVAQAAPNGDQLVRPGKGIGKVNLGMSEAQVRSALGKPTYVVSRRASFGQQARELQYGFDANFVVTLAGRKGSLRVTAVRTTRQRERMPDGFGIGTREPELIRKYGKRLTCDRLRTKNYQGLVMLEVPLRECWLGRPGSPRTVFTSAIKMPTPWAILEPEDAVRFRVIEIAVRSR